MRLVTYEHGSSAPGAGAVVAGRVVSLAPAGFPSMVEVAAGGEAALEKVRALAGSAASSGVDLDEVRLLAPVPKPPKIICVGLNYRDHAAEAKMEIPAVPTIFSKFGNTVIGPGAEIVLPKNSCMPDYEAELGVVIGVGGRHIAPGDWRSHVFGYTCINDVSARDFQMATSQWLMGKTFDTFCPMGPWITTADEIADPQALDIECEINGEVLQRSNTREMIFQIPALIEYLSSVMTLEPGDVISTGTPAGVGFAHKPPRWLRAGDVVTVRIAGLGELRNPVVAEE
jgi:2-keto-4-pentenoate hydratase/2-oxohepta-3-ene-1,7-dioic acid hydratase in catechol pathway